MMIFPSMKFETLFLLCIVLPTVVNVIIKLMNRTVCMIRNKHGAKSFFAIDYFEI